jgi:F-type H+-transporting ATPase subunit b
MINLDGSIIPAVIVFLIVIFALNRILFQPLFKVQTEREGRTTGLMEKVRGQLSHCQELTDRYQAAIKNERMEGYRRQEQVRAEGMKKRAEALMQARARAEELIQESRDSIQAQVQTAGTRLEQDAREIAGQIAANILRRMA